MRTIRLAMLGCGQISEAYFKQARALKNIDIVAICGSTRKSAEKAHALRPGSSYHTDLRAMLDQAKPEAIVITTPHSLHAAPAIEALRRGIHVLVEKPMATSLSDCRSIVKASEKSGALLMCMPDPASAEVLLAKELLWSGKLGKFLGASATFMLPGPPRDNWYYDRSIAGGGALLDCGIYPALRLIHLLGPAKSVSANINTLIPKRRVADHKRVESDVDDNCTLLLEWATGQHAVLRTLWGTSFHREDTAIFGREASLFLEMGKLLIHARDPLAWYKKHGNKYNLKLVTRPSLGKCFEGIPFSAKRGASALQQFATCILKNQRPLIDSSVHLHVYEILFRAYEAAKTGSKLSLKTRFNSRWAPKKTLFDTRSKYI